jgi:hypothetical protein
MPRAKRRCAKAGCNNFQPCPIKAHQRGWAASRSEPLPGNWKSLVKVVRQRSGGRCEVEDQFGPLRRRCTRPGVQIDHIINRARWPKGRPGLNGFHPDKHHPRNNLQDICTIHHDIKTRQERKEGAK